MQRLPTVVCNHIMDMMPCAQAWKVGMVCWEFWSSLNESVKSWELQEGGPIWSHALLKTLSQRARKLPSQITGNFADFAPWSPYHGYAGVCFFLGPLSFTLPPQLPRKSSSKIRSRPIVIFAEDVEIKVQLVLAITDYFMSCSWSPCVADCKYDAVDVELAGCIIHPCRVEVQPFGVPSENLSTAPGTCDDSKQILEAISSAEPLFCALVVRCSSGASTKKLSMKFAPSRRNCKA